MLRVPSLPTDLTPEFSLPNHISAVPRQFEILQAHVRKLAQLIVEMGRESHEDLAKKVPKEAAYVFKESRFLLEMASSAFGWRLRDLQENLLAGDARVAILTSPAGQGKTNLVCDFCERFLLAHRIPCMLITGRELRNVPTEMLDAQVVELAMGKGFNGTFKDFMRLVGEICEETGVPFTVIFDGINEHPHIPRFSHALEKLINEILQFPFTKVILTCRSEYYKERFQNLTQASFSNHIHHFHEINRRMSDWAKKQMMRAYFRHFRIEPGFMSRKVSETLDPDPLLLRFFCEAYGDPVAAELIRLEVHAGYLSC